MENLKKTIINSIESGYKQNLYLLSSDNERQNKIREYLLTVNVAQFLLDWNKEHIYKIHLEYPISEFYNNAFVPAKYEGNGIFDMKLINREDHTKNIPQRQKSKNISQQKIDIVITEEGQGIVSFRESIVGIELKGINQKKNLVIADVERLANAMIEKDKISNNGITCCYCVFLIRIDNDKTILTEKILKTKLESVKTKWDKECSILKNKYAELQFVFDIFEVDTQRYETVAHHYNEMDDVAEIAYDTYAFYACMLSVCR